MLPEAAGAFAFSPHPAHFERSTAVGPTAMRWVRPRQFPVSAQIVVIFKTLPLDAQRVSGNGAVLSGIHQYIPKQSGGHGHVFYIRSLPSVPCTNLTRNHGREVTGSRCAQECRDDMYLVQRRIYICLHLAFVLAPHADCQQPSRSSSSGRILTARSSISATHDARYRRNEIYWTTSDT